MFVCSGFFKIDIGTSDSYSSILFKTELNVSVYTTSYLNDTIETIFPRISNPLK